MGALLYSLSPYLLSEITLNSADLGNTLALTFLVEPIIIPTKLSQSVTVLGVILLRAADGLYERARAANLRESLN